MNSIIKEKRYDNGEIQRYQIVTLDSFDDLDFIKPEISDKAIKHLTKIYKEFFVKNYPLIFGDMFVYHLPDDYNLPFEIKNVKDKTVASRIFLLNNYKNNDGKRFINELTQKGYLYYVKSKNPFRKNFINYDSIGFLSEYKDNYKFIVNGPFFSFDSFDGDSPYDSFGKVIGMYLKDGKILNPPLYNREVFLVDRNNNVSIKQVSLNDLDISIKGNIYVRPLRRKTPKAKGIDYVVIGNKIVYKKEGGNTIIPTTGFVVNSYELHEIDEEVIYKGFENYKFGIECGNSILINKIKTTSFKVPYFNIYKGGVIYPPSNYPLDFNKARAPRIVLGNNSKNEPVIIWFEGKSKMKYELGIDSCGASLKELGDILEKEDIINAINLDGGGSAQIIYEGKRYLKISDRNIDNTESERPVPLGLIVKKKEFT